MKSKQLEPTIAAVIMSIGIYIYGPLEKFAFFNNQIGLIASIILLCMWIFIYFRLTFAFLFIKTFRRNLLLHPIESFAIGTWIAGVSILCNVLLKYMPYYPLLTKIIASINSIIWIGFLVLILNNFIQLFKNQKENSAHGIILLSAVGTQSISILLNQVYDHTFPLITTVIITIGTLFYCIGVFFIIKRYIHLEDWNILYDWNNTNCIIHGALSITGLAIVSMNGLNTNGVLSLWFFIFTILIFIELIEIVRMILRILKLGLDEGVFIYHVSQWSRIFTFGMFYVFTDHLINNSVYTVPTMISNFLIQFTKLWSILITFLIMFEGILYIKHLLHIKMKKLPQNNTFD